MRPARPRTTGPHPRAVSVTAARAVGLAVLLTALAGLTGCAAPDPAPSGGGSPTPPGGVASSAPTPPDGVPAPRAPSGVVPVPVHRATLPPVEEVDAPARLVVASLDIDMAVEPTGVEADGTMALLETGQKAAWYEYGPAPGTGAGTTVLASHVDTHLDGVGQFARLRDVEQGARATVTDAAGTTYNYTVQTVEQVAKRDVPLDEVFDRTGPPRLVLVTCGGTWDPGTRHYEDNLVVTAALRGSTTASLR